MDLFVRVIKNSGLAAAGREVGLSPASMSARINGIEQRYGTRLLNRTTRHVSPTETGRQFYDACQRILADVNEAETQLQADSETFTGPLRVTAPSDIGRQYIAPLLSEFVDQHPEVTPHLYLTEGVVNLSEQGFDLGVRYGDLPDSSLVARKLMTSRRVLCASPEYLKRKGVPLSPQDIQKHDCLVMIRESEPLTSWYFQTANGPQTVVIKPARSTNDGALLRQWALQDAGIILKSLSDVQADIEKNRLVTILNEYTQDFDKQGPSSGADLQAVYPSRRYLPPRVRGFIDLLVEFFASPDFARKQIIDSSLMND